MRHAEVTKAYICRDKKESGSRAKGSKVPSKGEKAVETPNLFIVHIVCEHSAKGSFTKSVALANFGPKDA